MESFLPALSFLMLPNVKCDLHPPESRHFPTFAQFPASIWDLAEPKLKRNEQLVVQILPKTKCLKRFWKCVIISSQGGCKWFKFKWSVLFFVFLKIWVLEMPPQRRAKFVICHLCHSASGDCLDLMNVAGTFVPLLPSINPEHWRQIILPGQLLPFWQSSGSEILSRKRLFFLIRLQMAFFFSPFHLLLTKWNHWITGCKDIQAVCQSQNSTAN